jgi:uncharacterized protein YdhG (YjbR/CyaY superfamily)
MASCEEAQMENKRYQQFKDIDAYFAAAPEGILPVLVKIRETIRAAAPEAQETISYSMPAFKQNGVLVYFAAFKDHIGFFPTAEGVSHFKKELEPYDTSKGTVRFPLDKPIPYGLIGKIVKHRVQENLSKGK